MPQVPYNPVPQVGQALAPTPTVHVNAPLEAFGGATAAALGNVGKALEHASGEIFNRAIALQQLDNEAAARDADTQYIITAGDLHAKYNTLQGKAASDAFSGYMKDLQEKRAAIRETLPNDATRKLFDSQSMSTMGRTIFNGAGHAASENKQYLIGSSKARIDAGRDAALATPGDDRAFQESVARTKTEVANLGAMDGWGPEQLAQKQAEAVSDLWTKRVEGLAWTKPFEANKMLKEAVKRGDIRGEQQEKITNFVRTQMRTIGARGISNTINGGQDLHWGDSAVSPTMAKEAIGTFESGNNYSSIGPLTKKYGNALGKYQVMEGLLPDYLKRAGLPPMSRDEFLKSPDAQEKVFEGTFLKDMAKYGSFNEAASRWFTGKSVADAREDFRTRGTTDATPTSKGTSIDGYLRNTNAILSRSVPLSQKVERSTEMARELSPDDPLMEDFARARVETDNAQVQRVKSAETFQARQTIETGLMGGKDGKIPSNLDELKANGEGMAEAWSTLKPDQQRRYLGVLARNAKGDVGWTQDGLDRYQTLLGMAQNNAAEFLDTYMPEETKLPITERKNLIKMQEKLKANAEGDPRVRKAQAVIQGAFASQLEALGIFRRTDSNKEDYDHYTGALQAAIDDYTTANKKGPDAKTIINDIAPRVLQERYEPRFGFAIFGKTRTPFFKQTVPENFQKAAKESATSNGEMEPSEQQIYQSYLRYQWMQLNKSGAKAK